MSEYRYSVHHTDWTDESRTELRSWEEDTAPTTALGRETTPTNDAEAWDAFLAMLVYFGCVPCWDVLVDERARFARTGKARLNGVSVKRVEEPTNPALRALRHHVSGAVERGETESIVGINAETIATPAPGSVVDASGAPCRSALPSSYPLYAVCENCGHGIACADSSASWGHRHSRRSGCFS